MKMTTQLTTAVFASILLAACGGGGGGSDKPSEPTRAAGMYMSAMSNPVSLTVKRVAGGNRAALKAAKTIEGEQIDPNVGLFATDEGGKEFRIHFELTDDKGVTTGYDEKVEPTSVIQITPDTVYLELFVKVNTNNSAETRQYLVQFSTGKMIEVQRLTMANAFLNQAYKYVLPANSLHNGTNDPIVLLNDGKWYSLDADWTNGAINKEYRSDYVSTYGSQGPAGNILFTADKQVDGAVKREMTNSVAEPFQVIQLTEDTAYAMMKECVQGTDGKWSFNYANKIINFADNSVTPVSDIVSLSAFIH